MTRPRSADFHVEGRSLSWSAQDRPRTIEQALAQDFDLVIIGGGITGAGVAREAALRGIPFLLAEKADFASGTSSRSSKLVHGGMRYLAQREFRLVRESTTERNWLRAALPNLVRPLGFYYCAGRDGKDTPGRVKLALRLYDLLSNTCSRFTFPRHRFLTPAQLAAREPAASTEGMVLAGLYYDANVDDARLTLEVLKEARDLSGGRSQALNYVAAVEILMDGGRVRGVRLEDRLTGRTFTVRAGCVVNATGAWTEAVLGMAGTRAAM
ncbi:MAG: FAD-dependent oxidoreductase, partial [Holophaga sp.]|nr:FAD-dependent oxidoreductase [Holophaga sp.]